MSRNQFAVNKMMLERVARESASLVMTAEQYMKHLDSYGGSDELLGSVYVEGDLSVDHKTNLDMRSLTGLSGILSMEGCENCFVGASIIGAGFKAEKARIIDAPNLRIVGGPAHLSRSLGITAPQIEAIDGPIDLREADDITARIAETVAYVTGTVYSHTERYQPELIC